MSLAIDLQGKLQYDQYTIDTNNSEKIYVVRIDDKILDVFPRGVVASDFNESATCLPGRSATMGKAKERFLDIHERGFQELVGW